MVKHFFVLVGISVCAMGGDFMLAIGSPVAASLPAAANAPGGAPLTATKVAKNALMAVRTEGCADPARAQITATAEGLVNGARQTMALKLMPVAVAGVFVISREWRDPGAWVVSLSGVCADAKAGALVPIGPTGFLRESSKFFPRIATKAELDATLKSISGGSK